jgi:hypothetical protein
MGSLMFFTAGREIGGLTTRWSGPGIKWQMQETMRLAQPEYALMGCSPAAQLAAVRRTCKGD